MATLDKIMNKSFFEKILPAYGQQRESLPVWDEGQKMFICSQYESVSGNRYLKGVRFCNNVAVVENVGLYHSWAYIDSIEVYAFNGNRLELVQKRTYEKTFRNEEFIRRETVDMLCNYMNATLKIKGGTMPQDSIVNEAKDVVNRCYKSFLDSDYNIRLTQILPQIEQ